MVLPAFCGVLFALPLCNPYETTLLKTNFLKIELFSHLPPKKINLIICRSHSCKFPKFFSDKELIPFVLLSY